MPRRALLTLLIALAVVGLAVAVAGATQTRTSKPSSEERRERARARRGAPTSTSTTTLPPIAHPSPVVPLLGTDGSAPVVSRVPTTDNVIFLGIDDGLHRDPAVIEILRREQVPATLFLNRDQASDGRTYFRELVDAGLVTIENHTTSHESIRGLPFSAQQAEVCSTSDEFTEWFGRRPTLFRPPYGEWDATTRQAASSCGLRAVVMWQGATNNGRLDIAGGQFYPGDILLMHFRPDLAENLELVISRARAEGFRIGRLVDYVGGP